MLVYSLISSLKTYHPTLHTPWSLELFIRVTRFTGEKHDISLKILHQAGLETAQQEAAPAKRLTPTIAPCPSLRKDSILWRASLTERYRTRTQIDITRFAFFVSEGQCVI